MNENQNQQEILSPIKTILAICIDPGRAMRSIFERPRVWLPLVLSIVFGLILFAWYYQVVDYSWLQERMTASISDPAARAQAQKILGKNLMLASSAGGLLIGIPFAYAFFALYFFAVAKVAKLPIGYGKWFAFVAWVSVPGLLTLPLGAIQILMAQGGRLDLNQLNPVSLNSLFFHFESGQHWASLLDSLSLVTLWSIVLSVVGFQAWSRFSRTTSILVVLLPYVVVYGVWSFIALITKAA